MTKTSVIAATLCVASFALTFAQDARPNRRFMNRSEPLVQINQNEPLHLAPPGMSWERFQSDASDFVVVARAERILSHLVYRIDMDSDAELLEFSTKSEAADENRANWIMSTVSARVERVLKGQDVIKAGSQISYEDDGGSLVLRGVRVNAVVPWHTPLETGKKYLWFASVAPYGRMWRNAMYVEPSPGAPLVSVTTSGRQRRLEGLTLAEAVAHVEREMRK